jgi:hypothetical protein
MKNYNNVDAARAQLDLNGGWLLDLGDGVFGVTKGTRDIHDMRESPEDYLRACEMLQHWDETKACEIGDHIANLMDDDIREALHMQGFDDGLKFLCSYFLAHREKFDEDEFIVN